MLMDFTGKTAFITGGAQGIGRECCLLFAEYGANIAVADFNLDGAQKLAGQINADNGRAIAVKIDVSDKSSVEAAVAGTVQLWVLSSSLSTARAW